MPESAPRLQRVMVVDDTAANRELARTILEDEGYTVVLAASGQEALIAFVAEPPACVLLDVVMPGMDGFSVCERLRAMPEGQDVPIIFLTAMRDVETFDRAALAGGDDFLTKPVHPTELLVRVQTALRLHQLGSERRDLVEQVRRQRDLTTRLQLHKEQLTNFLIHDLKAPVGNMALHAQSILHDPRLSEDSREAARHIESGARQVLRMLLNLLDINRGEQGVLSLSRAPTDLGALVRDVFAALAIEAETVGVQLRAAGEVPPLAVDPGLMRRTIANLVDHAIRHTPVDTAVEVGLSEDADGVLLRVAHAGLAPSQRRREAAFDRYAAPDEAGRHNLGLPFCRLAVEAHGGRVWIDDAAPGTVLHARLPRDA
jgi:two-component system, sensor histidine kinase and response regulator